MKPLLSFGFYANAISAGLWLYLFMFVPEKQALALFWVITNLLMAFIALKAREKLIEQETKNGPQA
jgi:hypothetical protein